MSCVSLVIKVEKLVSLHRRFSLRGGHPGTLAMTSDLHIYCFIGYPLSTHKFACKCKFDKCLSEKIPTVVLDGQMSMVKSLDGSSGFRIIGLLHDN